MRSPSRSTAPRPLLDRLVGHGYIAKRRIDDDLLVGERHARRRHPAVAHHRLPLPGRRVADHDRLLALRDCPKRSLASRLGAITLREAKQRSLKTLQRTAQSTDYPPVRANPIS
jgi:hypothetical protein